MDKKPVILFSTLTGNAFKLACAAADAMPCDYLGPYNIYNYNIIKPNLIEDYDTFIVTYWCDKGSADKETISFIEKCRGKNLIILGTLGVNPESEHGAKVRANVEALASRENNLVAHYLCWGSIDLKRTFEKTKIPEGEKGHLSMERFERQKLSIGHPNGHELFEAGVVVRQAMKSLYEI